MKQPIVLRIYRGDKLETVKQFEQSQIVIGRNSDVQLQLDDEGVALLHAIIEDRDGEYFLSDLGSQSGVFKNQSRILEDKILSGDQIGVGPFTIQFFIGVPKPAAPPKMAAQSSAEVPAPATPTMTFAATIPEPPALAVEDFATPPAAPAPSANSAPAIKPVVPKESPAQQQAKSPSKGAVKLGAAAPKSAPQAKGTFAPANPYNDLRDVLKPQKGPIVEILVTWNNKVLSTNHFSHQGSVFISSNPDADVVVPIISSSSRYELVKLTSQATICLTQEMTGEVIAEGGAATTFSDLARQNKLRNMGSHFELDLRQGEMARVGLQQDLITIYIRYKPDSPKPLVAPLLDMTSSEVTGVILALAVALIMAAYNTFLNPTPLLEDEARQEEPIRKAIVEFKPRPKEIVQVVEAPPEPPKPVEKKIVKVEDKKQETRPKAAATSGIKSAGAPGKPAELAPNPNVKPNPTKLASSKPGAAIKTAPKEGANMKSEKPDPTKVGLLSAFATKGAQKSLDKAYSGSGELQGMADAATGYAGNAENRDGDNLGTKLKDAGSGKGSSTVGISGVGTQGRGTGGTGYGTGGIGQKGSVQVNVGGQEADVGGGMDKEAIRRVIREHIREIRNCYERELQRSPDLYGKLVLQWNIVEGGRATEVKVVSNGLGNNDVAQCVSGRLRSWKFPDPPKDQIGQVVFPFVFSAQ